MLKNFTVKVYKVYLLTKNEIQTEQNSGLNLFVSIAIFITTQSGDVICFFKNM